MSRHERVHGAAVAPKGLLVSLTVLVMLATLATNLYLPSLPGIAAEFGADAGGARASLTAFLAAFAVAHLFWGPVSDRWGRRPVLMAGVVLYTLASAACSVAPNLEFLLVARALQGVGACAASVLVRAIARDWYKGAELARALAIILTLMTAAPGFSPLLGGIIEMTLGWRADFVLLALVGACAIVLTWRSIPESNVARAAPLSVRRLLSDYRRIATTPEFLGPTLATSLGVGGLFAFFASAPTIFIAHLGVSPALFGVVPAVLVFALFAGGAASAGLRRRFGANGAILIAALLMVAGGAGMSVLFLAREVGWMEVLLPLVLYLPGIGIVNPVATAAAMEPFPHNAGTAAALNGFFQSTGSSCGIALLGFFPLPMGLPLTLMTCSIGALLAAALCIATRRPAVAN
ncbi:MAG TPA: multidrug effflux MFS transporter [Burkholderiaceae bacterium]|nr:multidrug effflux MFS transporter [Burkholderiaceae bacterium]